MQGVENDIVQGAVAWLSEQRKRMDVTRARFEVGRRLTNAQRNTCRFALVANLVVAGAAVRFATTTARQMLLALPLPTYLPVYSLSTDALVVALFLLAALCLAQAWWLITQIRDDRKSYRALRQLAKIDRLVAEQILAARKTAVHLTEQLDQGRVISMYAQRLAEGEIQRLEMLSRQWSAPAASASKLLVNLLYAANVLTWAAVACFTLMGTYLQFVTDHQHWYTWDVNSVNLARWAFPAALLLLVIVWHIWLRPKDKAYNPAWLLILVLLVPLSVLLGWGIVALPYFLWEAFKIVLVCAIFAGIIVFLIVFFVG